MCKCKNCKKRDKAIAYLMAELRSEEFAAFKHKQYACIFEETEGAQ